MLYRADALRNDKVEATDGGVGIVKDLYFDDASWTLRYLVVDTGGWLTGREVLISAESVLAYDPDQGVVSIRLSKLQIENSPAADKGQPLSRVSEIQLSQYYGWSPYWTVPSGLFPWAKSSADSANHGEPNLSSFTDLKTYSLRASDGDIGQVEDLLIEPGSWRITHVIADTRLWWPGGLVAIDRSLIEKIDWPERQIELLMTRDQVKNSPAYSKDRVVDAGYRTELSDSYRNMPNTENKGRITAPLHPGSDIHPQY